MSGPSKIDPVVQLNIKMTDPSTPTPELVEYETIRETVVDGIAGIAITYGSLRLGLFAERQTLGKEGVERVLVSRLAMTTDAANIIHQTLKAALDDMVARGAIPPLPEVKII